MKKIIGWFKNILMRILEVINYMVKKDNEIELAKLEIKIEFVKYLLSDKNVRFVLGLAGVAVLCTCFHDFNKSQNILAN